MHTIKDKNGSNNFRKMSYFSLDIDEFMTNLKSKTKKTMTIFFLLWTSSSYMCSGVGTGGAGGACAPPILLLGGHCPPQYILKLSYMHYIAICKLVVRRD